MSYHTSSRRTETINHDEENTHIYTHVYLHEWRIIYYSWLYEITGDMTHVPSCRINAFKNKHQNLKYADTTAHRESKYISANVFRLNVFRQIVSVPMEVLQQSPPSKLHISLPWFKQQWMCKMNIQVLRETNRNGFDSLCIVSVKDKELKTLQW